ncbi:hypothetical protein RZS08_60850, partial [Arthrospira platensis SPKY1]|nr:hypothetical protein [Arthrospira platensis SPKY1]
MSTSDREMVLQQVTDVGIKSDVLRSALYRSEMDALRRLIALYVRHTPNGDMGVVQSLEAELRNPNT